MLLAARIYAGSHRTGLLVGGLILVLSACATPARRFDHEAARLGFQRQLVAGAEFQHVAYFNRPVRQGALMHVYLDGDGSPWINHRWVAQDPTPRDPLMLRLMASDPAPSVYLGRPCYHGLAAAAPCSPALWTHARYSVRVVDSMAAALRNIVRGSAYRQVALLGYSGGGALAMLLAQHLPETRAVVTLAGNLDTAAWAEYHGYTPLRGSLNPAQAPALDGAIVQLHYVGERDTIVPPRLIEPVVSRQEAATLGRFNEFNHRCCWEKVWSSILGQLDTRLQLEQ